MHSDEERLEIRNSVLSVCGSAMIAWLEQTFTELSGRTSSSCFRLSEMPVSPITLVRTIIWAVSQRGCLGAAFEKTDSPDTRSGVLPTIVIGSMVSYSDTRSLRRAEIGWLADIFRFAREQVSRLPAKDLAASCGPCRLLEVILRSLVCECFLAVGS